MDASTHQAQIIQEQGLLPRTELDSALQQLPEQGSRDLCEFLQQRGLLPAELAYNIRQQAAHRLPTQAQSKPRRVKTLVLPEPDDDPTVKMTSPLIQSPNKVSTEALEASPVASLSVPDPSVLKFVDPLKDLLTKNPWFRPHADLLWQRQGVLGQGGMGEVFRVTDKCLGRQAALKVLLGPSNEVALKRFLREAQITARLDHPAIPPVFEAGQMPRGEHYLVMKLIEGQTLREAIDALHSQGPLDNSALTDYLQVLVKVGEGVSYAHSQEVIHRDLKPENIMIGQFGEVLVLDWGIAKDLKESESIDEILSRPDVSIEDLSRAGLTMDGALIGTPGYMAPEQVENQVCKQSDVFALGAILTELLTGQMAVPGDSALARIVETASGRIRAPLELSNSVPKQLNFLAKKAMAQDPNERLTSVESFVDNLNAFLLGERLPDYPYSPAESVYHWASRRPGVLMSVIVLGLLSLSLFGLNKSFQSIKQKYDAETRTKKAREQLYMLKDDAKRGSPGEKIIEGVRSALSLCDHDPYCHRLAVDTYRLAKLYKHERSLLERMIAMDIDTFQSYFMLHESEMRDAPNHSFMITRAAERLLAEAEDRNYEDEITMTVKATKLFLEKRYQEALAVIQSLETKSETFAHGFNIRGVLKSRLGDLEGALKDLNKAAELDPKSSIIYNNRGSVNKALKQYRAAELDFSAAISYDTRNSNAYYNRALLRQRLSRNKEAYEDMSKALVLSPNDSDFWVDRGNILANLKDYKRAFHDYKKALIFNNRNVRAFFNRAVTKMEVKDYQGADQDYTMALQYGPKTPQLYKARAAARRALGNYRGALEDLVKITEPRSPHDHALSMAALKILMGDFKAAITDLDSAITIKPQFANAIYHRGLCKRQLGLAAEAVADFDMGLRLGFTKPRLYMERGQANLSLRRFKDAVEDFNKTLILNNQYPDAYYFRALANLCYNRFEDAIRDCSLAIEKNQRRPESYNIRGLILFRLNKSEDAIKDFSKAIELKPNLASAYLHRCEARLKNGQLRGAHRDFEDAIQLNPKLARADEIRKALAQKLSKN